MNVASLELCKELYELSGWDDVLLRHPTEDVSRNFDGDLAVYTVYEKLVGVRNRMVGCDECEGAYAESLPAYDLGYLLRKLPYKLNDRFLQVSMGSASAIARYGTARTAAFSRIKRANTPEDAAAKLCIELLKQGVLTGEDKDNE